MCYNVCIIGAGVIGLSSALHIQKLIQNVNITVIADGYGTETNTPVSENLFIPAPFTVEKDISTTLAKEWFMDGWKHHYELATQTMEEEMSDGQKRSSENGNTFKKGTFLWYHPGRHVMEDAVLDYRELSREEMDEKEYRYAYGCEFKTVFIDQKLYLRWLMKKVRANGGITRHDTICSFQELYGQFDVVVNCVGKRGRELSVDPRLLNFRGNVVQTTPIESEDFLITQDRVYVCPNPFSGYCDVGFLYDPTCWETEVSEDNSWLVKYRGAQFVPELKKCQIIESFTERRVERDPICLEIEFLDCGGPILPIVHNIGHGENAVSLAWGRGYQAAHLVQDVLRLSKPFAWRWHPFGKM